MNVLVAIGIASGYLPGADEKKGNLDSNISSEKQETFIGFNPLADDGQFRLVHRF